MELHQNKIKVYTTSSNAELYISTPSTKQNIEATNNRAQYFADMAKKFRDEAKEYRDNAKYYSEQNTNVTMEYLDGIKQSLESQIAEKQDSGDYALNSDIPTKVSELVNDSGYVNQTELAAKQDKLTAGDNITIENNVISAKSFGFNLFDTRVLDHVLTYEETLGWALQGTYVYKIASAGNYFGYPDFYQKCVAEKTAGTATQVTLGDSTITMYVNSNGHQYYDIADKSVVDTFYNTYGIAWFYGVDTQNERIFLPRNDWFEQMTGNTADVAKFMEAGLPNITGEASTIARNDGGNAGAFANSPKLPSANSGITTGATGWELMLDASLSNPIYGNSSTVQPASVKKLLYICVGKIISDTSWVDVVTEVEEGVADIENATNEGLAAIANASSASNTLRQSQITGCILSKPERLKVEINDGTLTLKAGSVVIYPNGLDEDGNKQFEYYTVPNDISYQNSGTFTGLTAVALNTDKGSLNTRASNVQFAGAAEPSGLSSGTDYYWYDTTNNLIKYRAANSATWTGASSFPIAVITKTNGIPTDINQIFNGVGFIGSVVWVDKDIKALIPDGRNANGTSKNIEYTTTKLTILNARMDYTTPVLLAVYPTGSVSQFVSGWHFHISDTLPDFSNDNYHRWFSPRDNIWYRTENGGTTITTDKFCLIGAYQGNGTVVTSANSKNTVNIVDSNNYYRYETPYFNIAVNGLYSFDLSGKSILSLPVEYRKVSMLAKVKTAQSGYKVNDIIYPQFANYVGSTSSSEIGSGIWISGNSLNIRFGNDTNFIHPGPNGAINAISKANVQVKIIVEGWLE